LHLEKGIFVFPPEIEKTGDAMKVLLAIDSSKASNCVVEEASARPWPSGTEFSVLHVVDVQTFGKLAGFVEDARQQGLKLVKGAAETLAASGHKTECDSLLGFPKNVISEYAKQWGADLVMAGSHGQGAIKRFLIGSVAQGILRTAPCSVEIVRPSAHGAAASSHPLKIILATDGSEFSRGAAKSLATRPWPKDSQVKIVSAVEILIPDSQISGYPLSSVYPPSLLDELMQNAQTHAKEAVESTRKLLTGSKLKVMEGAATPLGDPRISVLDEAKDWGADLIVMGSHGRRGFNRLLLGSVSESVAVHAHCSVEVIRLPQPEHDGK
jgi:nucleotide-binding universal stress UspA family protein